MFVYLVNYLMEVRFHFHRLLSLLYMQFKLLYANNSIFTLQVNL